MTPVAHAKLTYFWITFTYLPEALWLAFCGLWFGYRGNESKVEQIMERVQYLVEDRRDRVLRTFRFHKNGYELLVVKKRC